jgi:hypothetical protein
MKKRVKPEPPIPAALKRPRPYLMISQQCFEKYFWLEGPGRKIAIDALSAGVVSTSYEAVDILCLANLMYEDAFHDLITSDMAALGYTINYKSAKTEEEIRQLTSEAFAVLDDDRIRAILRKAEAIARGHLAVPETNAEWLPSFLTASVH